MPVGYRQRVAPEYFSKAYSVQGRTGLEYATDYLENHGASGCKIAKAMIDALSCVDHLVLTDEQIDLVNLVSTEYLARRAYGVELAFSQCKTEADWRKPKNAGKDWVSKVDFEMWKRINPGTSSDRMGGEYM